MTKQPALAVTVTSALLLVLFVVRYLSNPVPSETTTPFTHMPVGRWLGDLSIAHPVWELVLVLLIAVICSFLIVRTISRYRVYEQRTYLPSQFFIITGYGCFFPGSLVSALLGLLLIRGMIYFADSFNRAYNFGKVLRAGLCIGIMPLVYGPAAMFLLLVPSGCLLLRRSARELVVCLAGAVLPFFIFSYIIWCCGGDLISLAGDLAADLVPGVDGPAGYGGGIVKWFRAAAGGMILLNILAALVVFLSGRLSVRTWPLKILHLACICLVLALAASLLRYPDITLIPMIAIPAAFLMPLAYIAITGKLQTIFYGLTILATVALNIVPWI